MVHNKTKKTPFKFFLVIIIMIMFITVLVDLSSDERQLIIPENTGILDLSTCQNYLVALTKDNHVHLWDWQNLSGDPESGTIAMPAVVIDSDRIAWYKPGSFQSVEIKYIATNENIAEFSLSPDDQVIHITANRDRSILAVLLEDTTNTNDDVPNVYQLVTIDLAMDQYRSIVNIGADAMDYQLKQCAISDDGKWGIILGARQDQGIIIMIDILRKEIVREIDNIPEVKLFNHAAFGPEGNWFFAGGDNLVLYKILTDTGHISSRILVDDDIRGPANQIAFFDIAVSPDGKMVAAITNTHKGGVWDCASGEKIIKSIFRKKLVVAVAFSPDSSQLAIGPLQDGGKISIIRLPE